MLFSVSCAIVVFHIVDFSCLKLEVLFMLKLGNIFYLHVSNYSILHKYLP